METENGFLWLQECEVVVVGDKEVPDATWVKVDLDEGSSSNDSADEDETHSSALDLVVAASDNESAVVCGPLPRFDGTFKDTKSYTATSRVRKQRSDASLLLGLALTCQDLGHIVIKAVRCRIQGQSETSERQPTDDNRRVACMYITFYVPQVSVSSRRGHSDRQFMTASSKILPPSTQLLLMLMRSDWDFFESILSETSPNLKAAKKLSHGQNFSLFPSKLHLNEVYPRIGTAASLDREIAQELKSRSDPEKLSLDTLPRDILQHRVAVFLKARSLDSLRCTCKSFHRDLRSVVPGLKLKLYAHQVKSLGWMRYRETKSISEDDLVYTKSRRVHLMDGDPHRAASGGASTLLMDRTEGASGVHISQFDGKEVFVQRDDPLARMVARGGMLCDDPGLGKTITVLSLLLQTFGLSTSSTDESQEIEGNDEDEEETEKAKDERIFEEYWNENLVPRDRATTMLSFLTEIRKKNRYFEYFEPPVDPVRDGYPDYHEVIKDPLCFKVIRRRANDYKYETFESFEQDIEKMFADCLKYFTTNEEIQKAAVEVRESFRNLSKELKAKIVKTAKKSFARAGAKPNSKVAALVENSRRTKLKNSLTPSSATLLVVPGVLLEHWEEQLKLHVDASYCTSKIPIVFAYTGSKTCGRRMQRILEQCDEDRTHYPLLFIDKVGTRTLPAPEFLSKFAVVLTTNQRFTNEWKNGSFEDELNRKQGNGSAFREDDEEACPLLKVNWLRMIVDEGHSMGKGKDNSAILFASWIHAERRWVMTGTPTRQTLSQTGLTSIQNLLQYLGHTFFSRRQNGDNVWSRLISQGWTRGYLASFYRIQALLSLLMVRHTKMDIEELPPPKYKTTVLPMSADEVTTYNTLVCAVQSNLFITSMEGKTSGAQDSLLDKSQQRHAKRALENVRLVCAGGTQVLPTLDDKNRTEFIRDLKLCDPPPEKFSSVKQYLNRAVMGDLSPCGSCGMMLSTLLVFPCGDLVCTECADRNSHSCVVCDKPFDVDSFQRLQPGMVYEWLHNVEEELKKKKSKGEGASVSSVTVDDPILALDGGAGVLAPLDPTQPRRRTRKPGDGHACEFSPRSTNGECILCWKKHDSCNFMSASRQCSCCFQRAEDCPESETKSFHVVQRLLQLYKEQQDRGQKIIVSPSNDMQPVVVKRPLKAIVFSQFRKVLNMAGDRLLRRFGSGCVAEYWGSFRRQELSKFIHDDSCFCMLLGKDGSEGLDLSFVTHIFFLEEVWDKSLQEQAIARAWRMGAKGSVFVETLVAQNSVEQTMAEMEKKSDDASELPTEESDSDANGKEKTKMKSSEYQRAKLQYLLKGLSLVANQYTSSFGVHNKRQAQAIVHRLISEPVSKKPRKTDRTVRFEL